MITDIEMNFRHLREIALRDLSAVNIFVGPNNAGKTSIRDRRRNPDSARISAVVVPQQRSATGILHQQQELPKILCFSNFRSGDPILPERRSHQRESSVG